MEIKSGIYKITNIENNRAYIGHSVNIYERWKKHRSIGITIVKKIQKFLCMQQCINMEWKNLILKY